MSSWPGFHFAQKDIVPVARTFLVNVVFHHIQQGLLALVDALQLVRRLPAFFLMHVDITPLFSGYYHGKPFSSAEPQLLLFGISSPPAG
jgi:hypothetical protein